VPGKPPDKADRLRIRRFACPAHQDALEAAHNDYEEQHGHPVKDALDPVGAELEVGALAAAQGIVADWQLADEPDRPYDPAAMAAAYADPELGELRDWIRAQSLATANFRPDEPDTAPDAEEQQE